MALRRRRTSSVRAGDGSELPTLTAWQAFTRTVMTVEVPGQGDPAARAHTYGVLVDLLGGSDEVRLYRDGVQTGRTDLPARIPVPGGVLEVSASIYGLSRAHLVDDAGREVAMRPAPGTAEHWRATAGRRHPAISRISGWLAVLVLLAALALALPQIWELISRWDLLDQWVSEWASPVDLPAWANTTLAVAAVVASTERALTVRSHWLVDADTSFLDE